MDDNKLSKLKDTGLDKDNANEDTKPDSIQNSQESKPLFQRSAQNQCLWEQEYLILKVI